MEVKGATIFSENELLRAGGRLSVRSTYWSVHLASRWVRDAPRWSPSWPSSGWNAGASSLSNSAWYFDLAMVKLSPEMCRCVCALSRLHVGMLASILAQTPGSPSLPLSPAEDWFWLGHCLATDAFWLVSTVSSLWSAVIVHNGDGPSPVGVRRKRTHGSYQLDWWLVGLSFFLQFFSRSPSVSFLSYPSVSFKSSLGFNSL